MEHAINYQNGILAFDSGYVRTTLAAIHLIVENGRAAFVDTGTNDSLPRALEALALVGLTAEAVDYVLLTHIHLDHAGGAGAMMQAFPNAKLVVHPRGARHMAAPDKLFAGVCAVYGADNAKRLYGTLLPIPAERIIEAQHEQALDLGGRSILCLDTPGHARHHLCFVDLKTKGIFTGDMFGLAYPQMPGRDGQPFLFPATTPVQFEPDEMHKSMDLLLSYQPEAMYLTHYARIGQGAAEIAELGATLHRRVDDLVACALRSRATPAGPLRHAEIHAALTQYMLDEARTAGVTLDEEAILDLWETDLDLDAQGLGVWLDQQLKTA